MDKRKARRLYQIGEGTGVKTEEEKDAEEEGWWEGRYMTTKKGHCTVRGDDYYNNYAPSHPESETAAPSDLEPAITFAFGPRFVDAPPISRGQGGGTRGGAMADWKDARR